MSIVILGIDGQLGGVLFGLLSEHFPVQGTSISPGYNAESVDVTYQQSVFTYLHKTRPKLVINCTAYTDVDGAESNADMALNINARAVENIAGGCRYVGAALIHFSTDYVFDGSGHKPWVETDYPNPLSVYGRTKLDGERAIRHAVDRAVVIRTSWLYGGRGKNFLSTMLGLCERPSIAVIDDQIGAPTSVLCLADAVLNFATRILNNRFSPWDWGIYHVTSAGEASWYDFACKIFEKSLEFGLIQSAPQVTPIKSEEYPALVMASRGPMCGPIADRPKNSRLCCHKYENRFGVFLPSWQLDLARTLLNRRGA